MKLDIRAQCRPCIKDGVYKILRNEEQASEHLWYQHSISVTPAFVWNFLLRAD